METIKKDTLEYIRTESISVPHCFTTRFGGVSTGVNASLNLALNQNDTLENVETNLHILADALGFDENKLVMTHQIHSNTVRVVTEQDHVSLCHRDYPDCDGLVTNTPGVTLLVFTADCTPLLLYDPVTGAVGAAHAGWRGTASAIGAKCVEAMVKNFGSDPKNIRAAIGPNIAMCHFETDEDVPQAMRDAFGDAVEPFMEKRGEKYHLDLKAINAMVLRRAGVETIDISDDCTCCSPERFWSHRVTRGARGSQGALIVCKKGDTL